MQSGSAQDFEALRKRLPYDVIPTNIPGVFAVPAPPEDVDLSTASATTLLKHGVNFCHPKESDHPGLRAAWKKAFSRRWHAKDRIVPHLEPQIGKTHILTGLKKTESGYVNNAWSGGVFQSQGQFPNVSGFWVIPTVTQPSEPQGREGGWNSGSWIGIDGFNTTNDVLQAGVQQVVNSNGQASYVAWYEWFVPSYPGAPPYIYQTNITNFPVSPGDQIYCCVQYVLNNAWGQVQLANETTGQQFIILLLPPTGASFNASSIEWIMEAPDGGLPTSALPSFTPVNFNQALGWANGQKGAVADPQNGDYVNISNGSTNLTSVTLGSLFVTIDFIG